MTPLTVEQLNEFINRGGAALALTIIALILAYYVFSRDFEKASHKSTSQK